jgi:16S rRNA (adenine1518-N6/adenine1519-N6)-dimethyltransferase
MDLLQKTLDLSKKYNIKPARSKGQNFLISENIYDKMIEAADLRNDDVVLEVGPGLGFLTEKLASKVKKVITVELDDKLADVLLIKLDKQGITNVKVVNENILDFEFKKLSSEASELSFSYKIVANLPYNISSIFLRKFLSEENKPETMTLMLQKEVAERIVAKPGKMSMLAVSVQFYADAEIIQNVGKENFWPMPEVDSAIIKLKVHKVIKSKVFEDDGGVDEKKFFRLVKFGFIAKRKMLKNNLAAGFHISQSEVSEKLKLAGFNEKIRAQELSVADWVKLLGVFG